jgi:GAF domain-containing protein
VRTTERLSERRETWNEVLERIDALLEGETDWIAAMATVVCELHHAFDHFDWTGFYRAVDDDLLIIGPYQGGHGCQRIEFGRGVCGTSAAERRTVVVDDVDEFPGYIACDAETLSEIVVPVLRADGRVLAVLDVDSRRPAAFGAADVEGLEELCRRLGARYG